MNVNYLTDWNVFIRQIANGSMAIGALFVIGVFAHYIIVNWSKRSQVPMRAAVAIIILTLGHLIRSSSAWLEFMWMDLKWDLSLWAVKSWTWFLMSAVLVLVGKALMLLNFSPWEQRRKLTITAIACAVLIPLAIALVLPD